MKKFSEITIEIHTFSFKKLHFKMSGKWQTFCLGLNELMSLRSLITLQWRHNGHHGVSNHQPHHCLLNYLFRCRSKKTSKLSVTGLCAGNSPVTVKFPAQMASKTEHVSICWRHHDLVQKAVTAFRLNLSCNFFFAILMKSLQNKINAWSCHFKKLEN